MPSLVDYDSHYRRGVRLFGPPLRELGRLLDGLPAPTTLLDLGCGQGRNALFAARRGHTIVGVDLSPTGITQMLAIARTERLPVTGVVGDVLAFRSRRKFGVVLLDRVLQYLPSDTDRHLLLERVGALTRRGGLALVTTTPRHRAQVLGFFAERPALWTLHRHKASFACAERR